MRHRFSSWWTGFALVYRWSTLVAGLLIALLADTRLGDERIALLAPVAVAIAISVLAVSSRLGDRALAAGLVTELLVAGAALQITGLHESPLLLYMTSPAMHAAVTVHRRLCISLVLLALGLLFVAFAIDTPEIELRPGALVRDVALHLLPLWMLAVIATARRAAATPLLQLEDEDRAVAELLVAGHTYKEIASSLSIGQNGAKVAVARLYRRLGARNRGEAVNLIVQSRLLKEGSGAE
jgi:DNA-binding CsgD family transcriptional regulator